MERIAVAAGHLPKIYPFVPASALNQYSDDVLFESSDNGLSESGESDTPHSRPTLSNRPLVEALGDQTKCLKLYLTLTKTATKAYESCGKINSVIRLKANLAGLAM